MKWLFMDGDAKEATDEYDCTYRHDAGCSQSVCIFFIEYAPEIVLESIMIMQW